MLQQNATDQERLDWALERMFKSFYPYWKTIKELRQADDPEALLAEWRSARKPSQAWRKAHFYHEAVGILAVALGLPREEAEQLVWRHIAEDRQREAHDVAL